MSMSIQDGLPFYVDGMDTLGDQNAPGRLAVYDPSNPDAAKVLTTVQESIPDDLFGPLEDAADPYAHAPGGFCDHLLACDPRPAGVQLPTVAGMCDGIVSVDPLVLQCRSCAATYEGTARHAATDVILSGYRFHTCEGTDGVRRCPPCHAAVIAACPNKGRHQ